MKVGTDAVLLGCLANVSGTSALEVGCGCGVISLMIAQRFPTVKIMAIDIHKPSVDEAFKNFQSSIWNNRLNVEHQSLQEFSEVCATKFDTIISNPPFFSKSLQPPDTDRTNTRHTTTLTYDDLMVCCEKLLTTQGQFSIIIPTLEYKKFQKSILQTELHIHQILHIFGVNRKNSKRVILECGFENKPVIEESFFLHHAEKLNTSDNPYNYSDEYFELVKDFLCISKK